VRAIFDAPPTARGWFEAHDLVGRVHCELLVVQPEVPVVLRRGASRAFPGALAGAVAIGATHASTLRSFGLDVGPGADDSVSLLLVEALRVVVPIAHSGGTLFQFERDLYGGDADPGTWNQRWWTAAARFEGLAPPAPRDERWCDPAAEQRLFEEPAQGYDDALERVIAFQIHDHIARKLLDADVHDVDIHGRTEVGDFVKSIARFGATVDWRTKLREKLGYEISARAIMEYFEPLRLWLERRNAGRTRTLPPM
jgi:peptidyl-dipeptidase A